MSRSIVEPISDQTSVAAGRRRPTAASRLVILCAGVLVALVGWSNPASSAERRATGAKLAALSERVGQVDIEFSEAPSFSARISHGGTRLIVDIPASRVGDAPSVLSESAGPVEGAVIQQFDGAAGPLTRLLVTLQKKSTHAVRVEGKHLLVTAAAPGVTLPKADSALPVPVQQAARFRVSHVGFSATASGHRLVVQTDGEVPYRVSKVSPTQTRLELHGASVVEEHERTLDVRAFGAGPRMVSTYEKGDDVWVEVEHQPGAEAHLAREGSALTWTWFEGVVPAALSGVAADGGAARRIRTVFSDETITPEVVGTNFNQVTESAPLQTAPLTEGATNNRGRYSGRRVDIDLKDADIHNVLRLLADVGRRNIITADNVAGSVTIRMRNVPWDQALEVVLQSKKLGMKAHGNIIRVAPLAELEKEREMQIARMRQELKLAPIETRLIPVSYASAANLQARAQDLLSSRGSIAVDERTNVMIVRDVAGNLDQVEELTRSLDTQTPQVLIEARIVEATSRYLRDVGIQWGGDASFSPSTGNPTGLAFPNSIGLAGGASDGDTPTAGLSPFQSQITNPNFAVNLPAAVGTGSGGALGLTFGSVDSNFNLSLRLSAAETSGMLRILSSPRVLTLDNSTARISQGTLIPFSQVSAQGVQTTFQEAKLQLLVTPHVTADGSVSMNVKINRDEPDFNQTSPRGDPTILKREAQTNLLVMDGHTAVIGGIYTRNMGRNVDQVPFFGDIPLLGLLFQKRSASDTRGELVIFLTPRIVNRAEALGR